MFISEPSATDKYEDTFIRILESYSTPSEDDSDATPTGGAADSTPTAADDDSGSNNSGPAMAVGESGESDGLTITLNSVRRTTSGLLAPDAGKEYLIVNLTAENTTKDEKVVSSLLNFSVRDAGGDTFSQSFTAGVETSLDGEVPAGEQLTGEIA